MKSRDKSSPTHWPSSGKEFNLISHDSPSYNHPYCLEDSHDLILLFSITMLAHISKNKACTAPAEWPQPTAQSTGPVCRNTTAQNSCKRPVQSWVEADQERWYISMLSWGCLLYWKTRSVVNRLGRNFSKLSSRVMRSTTHENCEEKITMFILYFLI